MRGAMRGATFVGVVVACVATSMGGCAGSMEPDEVAEVTPDRSASAHLFDEADGMVARADADGSQRACELAREALAREALEGEDAKAGEARAAFCDAEVERVRWESIAMDSDDMNELRASLERKIAGLTSVKLRYEAVYPFAVMEWTLAAGTREASLYDHFGEMLLASPTPGMLDEESAEVYRQQLSDIATPLLDDADKRYALVVAKADELGFSSAYIDIARAQLKPAP